MAFNVGDPVICQKTGGQSGKNISPPFTGVVRQVLAGSKYDVKMTFGDAARVHFKDSIVDEAHMTAA